MNTSWPKWIVASAINHFSSNISGLPLLIEGQPQEVRTNKFCKISLDGPHFEQPSKGYFKVGLTVSILVSCPLATDDLYVMDGLVGAVLKAFTPFHIYKFGKGPDDNPSTAVACMRLVENPGAINGEKLSVNRFGQIDSDVNLQHTGITGYFVAELED